MSIRAKQTLAILASLIVAGVMLLLGLWQMSSYEESTRDVSAERAAQAPVALADQVSTDGAIADVYGRRVTLSGTYLPDYQVLVGAGSPWRVATAFRMADDRIIAVVRGAVEPGAPVPSPPSGEQDIVGVFLAPDRSTADSTGEVGDLPTLRVQELAQTWPSPLIGGYVTLSGADSATQGLAEAPLVLPEAEGSPTHRGYALQWWVFAAGAIAFGIYAARGLARKEPTAA
jgi:cytochrome oxidase assembly protein ShyY1